MKTLDADAVARALTWPALIAALERAFSRAVDVPPRQVHPLDAAGLAGGSLLVMPAWAADCGIGVKIVTYAPDNASLGLPRVHAAYLLFDATDGRPCALVDGDELTVRRTAAVSALAARRLARDDARTLLVVGTGHLAPYMAEAHASVREYRSIRVWGRSAERAAATVSRLRERGLPADVATDLDAALAAADVVTCATASGAPLVRGSRLRPGVLLDLVGSFRPDMREADDDAIGRAAAIVVDSRSGALRSGDLAQPIAAGMLTAEHVVADLHELLRRPAVRRTDDDVIVFKSAGHSLADLAAARLAVEAQPAARPGGGPDG